MPVYRKWPAKMVTGALVIIGLISLTSCGSTRRDGANLEGNDNLAALGKALFFDQNLSANGNQACSSCHSPEVGFASPDAQVNAQGAVIEGSVADHFGNRNPPTAAYAGDSPVLQFDEESGDWIGGMFWDGRATGETLGDPLAEQAQGPFLNPLEQAVPDETAMCNNVKQSDYADLFEEVWGAGSLDCEQDAAGVFEKIARSIAAFERSSEVSPFTSKFDQFWDNAKAAGVDVTLINCGVPSTGDAASPGMGAGMGMGMGMGMGGAMSCRGFGSDPNSWTNYRNLGLTDDELQGFAIFNDPNVGDCTSCHSLQIGEAGYPLFTDFRYDNLGIPKNPDNPFYTMDAEWNPDGEAWVDQGLGGYLKAAGYPAEVYEPELGKFRVPTLRNIDVRPSEDFVRAYGHNGFFKTLEDIIFFYHWRAAMDTMCGGTTECPPMMAGMFPPPEVDQNLAVLPFFPERHVTSILTFLKTLSDGSYEK